MPARTTKRYTENPFLKGTAELATLGTRKVCEKADRALIVVDRDTGEFQGMAGFWYKQEVDKTQFVKVFAEGLREITDMKSAGLKVFQIIYGVLMEKPNQDSIFLNYDLLENEVKELKLSQSTFFRGINECINHNIIAPSVAQNFYFVNPAYIYNGNRVTRIHEYILKSENGELDEQIQLKRAEELAQIAEKQDKEGNADDGHGEVQEAENGENPA